MLPILLSLGPIKIYSYGLFLAIGLFLALYFWWKMGRDEHFDEIALFDGYFLSLIVFLLAGRAAYVMIHSADFGSIYRTLGLLAYPGVNGVVGIIAAVIFIILFARSHGWDEWKVADSVVVAIAITLIFGSMGGLLNGSNPGMEASWGLKYAGQDVARVPLDVLMLLWSIVTFGVVSRVRKNFRFYAWYKGESSIAQEGLASLVFLALVGLYYLVAPWIDDGMWRVGFVPVQSIVGLGVIMVSGFLIYKRVGRRNEGIWSKLKSVIRRK